MPDAIRTTPFYGWRMVALACLYMNIGVGFTYGIYSTFMAPMIQEFSASRTLASTGMSIMVVTMGLLGPVVGFGLQRWSIRAALGAGFILMSIGWALISVAASAWQFVLSFGLLCGAAAACLVVVPPMTLVNNWFIAMRGRAAGIVNVLFMLMVVPPVVAASITAYGWRVTALIISIVCLLLAPLVLLVIDRPESIGQKPLGADQEGEHALTATSLDIAKTSLPIREPVFWVVMVGIGIFGGIGVAFSAHFVPFALETGLTLKSAALLFSMFGAAGLIAGLVGGFVADRLGGARTFACTSFIASITWPCLLIAHQYWTLALCVIVLGLCANSIMPIAVTMLANLFGRAPFARIMGMLVFITMPFNVALPLLSGALYDLLGSYRAVFVLNAALLVSVGIIFAFVHRIEASRGAAEILSIPQAAGH